MEFIEFIETYWKYISVGILFLVEILLIIFKRRPQVVDNSFLSKLSIWILEAEDKFKVGSDKMAYVLECAKDYLQDKYSEKEVRQLTEYLLTLPEKKGKK